MCSSHSRFDQLTGGIFLIGLAFLFLIGDIFPGIMFVIAITCFVRGIVDSRDRENLKAAAILFGLGLIFTFGFHIGLLLLLIGLVMLFGAFSKSPMPSEKRKNTEFI